MEKMNLVDAVGMSLDRNIIVPGEQLVPRGVFKIEHIVGGKVAKEFLIKNGITTAGKNALFDSFFRNTAPPAAWYCGLIDNASFSALDAADTIASHAGWIEFDDYSEAVRQTWSPAAASAAAISNSVVMTFNINASGTVKGIFIVSNSTKLGTTGTLWSTASFGSTVAVNNTDQLKITYSLSA